MQNTEFVRPEDLDLERQRRPSASNIERLMYCPASFKRSLEYAVKEPPSYASERGTLIHNVLAGKETTDVLSKYDLQIVHKIKNALDSIFNEVFKEGVHREDLLYFIEERFWYRKQWIDNDKVPQYMFSAKPDFALYDATRRCLVVIEFKTGVSPVTRPYFNWQLRAQACAIVEHLLTDRHAINNIHIGIIQPEIDVKPSLVIVNLEAIYEWSYLIELAIEEAESENPYALPGKVCTYCNAFNTCPEASAYAVLAIPQSQRPTVNLANVSPEQWIKQSIIEWNSLPIGAKIDRLRLLDIASKMYEGLKSYIKQELKNNPNVYGEIIKLSPGYPKRNINIKDVINISTELGITEQEILSIADISLNKLELLYCNKQQELNGEPVTKTVAKRYKPVFDNIVSPYIKTVDTEPRLVMSLFDKNKSVQFETKQIQ